MEVTDILRTLPASLEWMVLFKLSALRKLTDESTIKAMFHLPLLTELSGYSHVILANTGRFLACEERSRLVESFSGRGWSRERIRHSLWDRFQEQLSLFSVNEADCVGLGESAPHPPVLLHIKIQDGVGQAQATFAQAPSQQHYELLQAIGVQFLGGTQQGNTYLAQFQNFLPTHIHAGILSHFSRTAHCNLFFLRHGNIDTDLEEGLLKAAKARITWAKEQSCKALAQLSNHACEQSLAMTCQPPLPEPPFPYGDLVPLGFAAKALRHTKKSSPSQTPNDTILTACQTLESFLLSQRRYNLWAFHRDRLITATDSALVLQGLSQLDLLDSIEALEQFADGNGGYYPQLWSTENQPNRMVFDEQCCHWCQPDFATTCAIAALRKASGLTPKTSIHYLAARIDHRSGLYFANPYLVDWFVACALPKDISAAPLRQQLLTEILASINSDYSFGQYDIALSTALAILCLTELGWRDRTIQLSQLTLLNYGDEQGLYSTSTPFYSSLRVDQTLSSKEITLRLIQESMAVKASSSAHKQIRKVCDEYHAISLYEDTHSLITTAVVTLALSDIQIEHNPNEEGGDALKKWGDERISIDVHPRYQCCDPCDYIVNFALPCSNLVKPTFLTAPNP